MFEIQYFYLKFSRTAIYSAHVRYQKQLGLNKTPKHLQGVSTGLSGGSTACLIIKETHSFFIPILPNSASFRDTGCEAAAKQLRPLQAVHLVFPTRLAIPVWMPPPPNLPPPILHPPPGTQEAGAQGDYGAALMHRWDTVEAIVRVWGPITPPNSIIATSQSLW